MNVFFSLTLVVLGIVGTADAARATASVGVSQKCDAHGHCVAGSAFSANGGVNLTNAASGLGAALAACKGTANGSILLEVTCSIGANSQTIAFPGTAGIVPVATDTSTLSRVKVCWNVVGYFPNPSGEHYEVSTSGCALLAL
ncbi:MAG TPA: hypothetical protein VHN37_03710 [Actinomycetota bacterium]|nr:hypothetical protein [Actinomycetota bacterium]